MLRESVYLCCLAFCLTLWGCMSGHEAADVEVVNIVHNQQENLPVEDFISDFKFIALEDGDAESLLSQPRKAIVCNNLIYVSDSRKLVAYDMSGHSVFLLSRYGRGPEEYLGLLDFIVDNGFIYIMDQNKKLLKYALNGDFVASSDLEFFPASCYPVADDRMIVLSAYQSDGPKFHVLENGTLKEECAFGEVNEPEITWRHFRGQSNYFEFRKRLLFHEPINNVIYQLTEDAILPYKILDLWGHNIPASFYDIRFSNVMEMNLYVNDADWCAGTPVYAETERNLIFTYRDKMNYMMCRHDKKTGTAVQSDTLLFRPLQTAISIGNVLFGFWREDDALLMFSAHDIKPEIKESVLRVAEEFDGNVVCIGRLK